MKISKFKTKGLYEFTIYKEKDGIDDFYFFRIFYSGKMRTIWVFDNPFNMNKSSDRWSLIIPSIIIGLTVIRLLVMAIWKI